jgi:hypothetical protein
MVWEGMIEEFQHETRGYEVVNFLELSGSQSFRVSNRRSFDKQDLGLNQVLNDLFSEWVEQDRKRAAAIRTDPFW